MTKRRAARGEARSWLLARVHADTDECIEDWPFSVDEHGYPRIRWGTDRRRPKVAAVMCELTHGPKPRPELEACHDCGNHRCINGRHLRWDTHASNQADMRRHGTSYSGAANAMAKLTEDQVREMRALRIATGLSYKALGERFGVVPQTAWNIVNHRTWVD